MTGDKQHTLLDPASPVFGITSSVIIGCLSLIDASRLDDRQRRATRIGTAVVTGLYTGVTVGGTRLPLRVVYGLAAAAATLRFADLGDRVDARLEEKLRRAGAQHPRRWIAASAVGITFAGFLSDRASARRAESTVMPEEVPARVRPLDPRVRGIIDGMLDAGDTAGVPALRAQLDAAQELYWCDDFTPAAYFTVPDDLPRAVPHDQVFPVRAHFTGPRGVQHQAFLQLSAGHLDHLAVEPSDQDIAELDGNPVTRWPDPSDAVYVLDSPDGTNIVSPPTSASGTPSPPARRSSKTRGVLYVYRVQDSCIPIAGIPSVRSG